MLGYETEYDMRPEIHGLGWFVRRSTDPEGLGAFFRDVLGFPELRRYGLATMLWLGETVDIEIAIGGNVQAAAGDPATAQCVPRFEVASLEDVVRRLITEAGVTVTRLTGAAYFVDPSGNLVGLVERPDNPGHPTVLEGVPPPPAGFLRLGEIVRRCRDTAGVAAFYRDVVGLDQLSSGESGDHVLSLGASARLIVTSGGEPLPPANDRQDASNVFVVRVDDVDGVAADLVRRGVRPVNLTFGGDGGRIAYFADPEEQVFGVQTRLPESMRVEDREARRRRNVAAH